MKILLLDNYDSFTFNLFHLVEQFDGIETDVIPNDEIELKDVQKYDKILLSPGPGLPEEAGITMQVVKAFASSKSILGVCMGHQAIAQAFGARLFNLAEVQHGVSTLTTILDQDDLLFKNIPPTIKTGRYHSWMVDHEQLPDCLRVLAVDHRRHIMALRHKTFDVCGIQFHPESVLTDHGKTLIGNWLGR